MRYNCDNKYIEILLINYPFIITKIITLFINLSNTGNPKNVT